MAEDKFKQREPIVARRDSDVRAPRQDDRHGNSSASGFQNDAERDFQRGSERGLPGNKQSFARVDKPKTGGSVLVFLVILLALGLAGLAWFVWQQSQAQAMLQQRFDELAGKIESTDESLNQSGAALSVKLLDHSKQLETQWSEIKKLWGVANDRNKKAIEELQLAAAESDKASQKLTKNLATLTNNLATLADADKKLSGRIGELGSGSLAATARIEAVAERVDQLDGAQQRLRQLEERQRALEGRLQTNETAIQSIDAFRRQTNQTLNTLRQAQPAQ